MVVRLVESSPNLFLAIGSARLPSIAFNAAIVSVFLNGIERYGKSLSAVNSTSRVISTASEGKACSAAVLHNASKMLLASSENEYDDLSIITKIMWWWTKSTELLLRLNSKQWKEWQRDEMLSIRRKMVIKPF